MKKAIAVVNNNERGRLKAMSGQEREDFRRGVKAVLDYLAGV